MHNAKATAWGAGVMGMAGLAELGLGGKTAFVMWCAAIGAGAGKLFAALRAPRRMRRKRIRE